MKIICNKYKIICLGFLFVLLFLLFGSFSYSYENIYLFDDLKTGDFLLNGTTIIIDYDYHNASMYYEENVYICYQPYEEDVSVYYPYCEEVLVLKQIFLIIKKFLEMIFLLMVGLFLQLQIILYILNPPLMVRKLLLDLMLKMNIL